MIKSRIKKVYLTTTNQEELGSLVVDLLEVKVVTCSKLSKME